MNELKLNRKEARVCHPTVQSASQDNQHSAIRLVILLLLLLLLLKPHENLITPKLWQSVRVQPATRI